MVGGVAVACGGADANAAAALLDGRQRQACHVDEVRGPLHAGLHEVHEVGAAAEELRVGLARDGGHGGARVAGARVGERPHAGLPAAARTAATMLGYAPHRHRLPLMRSRISSSVSAAGPSTRTSAVAALAAPSRASRRSATAEQICPGVQYPHWKASCSMKAACTGCSASPSARPSIVVISSPACATARARHALIRRPSASTVHAPHWPWSQPFLVPVSPMRSRSRSSSVTRVSSGSSYGRPLIVSVGRGASRACPRASTPAAPAAPAAATPEATEPMNRRRLMPRPRPGETSLPSMTRADVARTMPTMPPRVLSKSERLLHAKHAVGREPLHARLAAQGHVPPQLVAQDVERVLHALRAAGGQPPERRASAGHHARPPSEPFQHGGAAATASTDDDVGAG